MLEAYPLDELVSKSFTLLKTASDNPSSSLFICAGKNGVQRRQINLRYPALASGVSPNKAKNTRAMNGISHSPQCTVNTAHLSADHDFFGKRAGPQFE